MKILEKKNFLNTAVKAAQIAGEIMANFIFSFKKINSSTQRDIKLELDVKCQKKIERREHAPSSG